MIPVVPDLPPAAGCVVLRGQDARHRATDWRLAAVDGNPGVTICGTCHPPAPDLERLEVRTSEFAERLHKRETQQLHDIVGKEPPQ